MKNSIVFLGADAFASGIFDYAIADGLLPSAIITYPPKEHGRGRALVVNPMERLAIRHSIDFHYYDSDNLANTLEILKASDLAVIISFRIIPPAVFNAPRLGMINIHPSLLPDLRGAAPLNWAIAKGYSQSGFTSFFLDEKVDSGKIIMQEEFGIPKEYNHGDLWNAVQQPASRFLIKTVETVLSGDYQPLRQDDKQSSLAPKIKPHHLKIDWSNDALHIHNQIRAFSPKPATHTTFNGSRVKVLRSEMIDEKGGIVEGPGAILDFDKDGIFVMTGRGRLKLLQLQPQNKKAISGHDFWLGYVRHKCQHFV